MKRNLYLPVCIVFIIGIAVTSFAQSSTTRIITTYAGNGLAGYDGDNGVATMAKLHAPSTIAMDGAGNLYINDQLNNCIRKVDASGIITTVAGTGVAGKGADGVPATSSALNDNWGVAADNAGNIYITEQGSYRVRKVTAAGIITTIAGTGVQGFSGDGSAATNAKMQSPEGVAVDGAGNVYIGDPSNYRVRRVDPSGIITTVAGNGTQGNSGDGNPASSAQIGYFWGLATDGGGNLYICDGDNNCIRKVNTAGIISTIAGTGSAGYTGDGIEATNATLNQPRGVYVNSSGEVFIADYLNHCIRKISASGIISTVAGTGMAGYYGDGGPATSAQLSHPVSVAVDAAQNMYLTEPDDQRVRKVFSKNILSFAGGRFQHADACENTATPAINAPLTIIDYSTGRTDTWNLLTPPVHGSVTAFYNASSTGGVYTPSFFSYVPATGYTGADSLTMTVSNGIIADTTTVYITVMPLPVAGSITGEDRVCAGSSITFSADVSGGAWSVSNGDARVSNGIVSGISRGLDTVLYSVTNSCGTAVTSKAIIIDSLPYVGVISGASAVCRGSTILLHEEQSNGLWSTDNLLAVVNEGVVSGIIPGKTIVKYIVADSFCIAVASHPVTTDSFPNAGIITGSQVVCIGTGLVLKDTAANGLWSSGNAHAIVSVQNANDVAISGITTGPDTIRYTVSNSCGTAVATMPIVVSSYPAVKNIEASENVFSVPPGYSSYTWTLNDSLLPGAKTNTVIARMAGDYAVTVTDAYGCSATSLPATFIDCNVSEMKIFPNPVSSLLYIQWCKRVKAKITCLDGKELRMADNANLMDLGNLPAGGYILEIYDLDDNKLGTKRIDKLNH
jgi:hypothetical protein